MNISASSWNCVNNLGDYLGCGSLSIKACKLCNPLDTSSELGGRVLVGYESNVSMAIYIENEMH